MGNLGAYQLMTTIAKKVGGPIVLLISTAIGGWALGRTVEAAGKKVVKEFKAKAAKGKRPCETRNQVFEVLASGESNQGLQLQAGDHYRVLECDADSILIEVVNGSDNPHFVCGKFLSEISGFPNAEPEHAT